MVQLLAQRKASRPCLHLKHNGRRCKRIRTPRAPPEAPTEYQLKDSPPSTEVTFNGASSSDSQMADSSSRETPTNQTDARLFLQDEPQGPASPCHSDTPSTSSSCSGDDWLSTSGEQRELILGFLGVDMEEYAALLQPGYQCPLSHRTSAGSGEPSSSSPEGRGVNRESIQQFEEWMWPQLSF